MPKKAYCTAYVTTSYSQTANNGILDATTQPHDS